MPQEVIDDILAAARLAPSASNRQPLSYIVIRDPQNVEQVFQRTRWAGYLDPAIGQPGKSEQPVLFIAVIQNQDISRNCDTDAGLAIGNMTLAAWNRGVGSCIIAACNKKELSELFGLNENQQLHCVIAFGYPCHGSTVVDVGADEDIRYYVDDQRNYYVPKRKLESIVKYL